MAQQETKGTLPVGGVLPKEPTAVRYIMDVAGRKRGHITTMHRALAEKMIGQGKVELYKKGMADLGNNVDAGSKSKSAGKEV